MSVNRAALQFIEKTRRSGNPDFGQNESKTHTWCFTTAGPLSQTVVVPGGSAEGFDAQQRQGFWAMHEVLVMCLTIRLHLGVGDGVVPNIKMDLVRKGVIESWASDQADQRSTAGVRQPIAIPYCSFAHYQFQR
jgi:hypothetical protein